jgi:hypothetical protein
LQRRRRPLTGTPSYRSDVAHAVIAARYRVCVERLLFRFEGGASLPGGLHRDRAADVLLLLATWARPMNLVTANQEVGARAGQSDF